MTQLSLFAKATSKLDEKILKAGKTSESPPSPNSNRAGCKAQKTTRSSRSRFRGAARFFQPSPLIGAPPASDGKVPAFFRYASFSKQNSPTINGKPTSRDCNKGSHQHALYIEGVSGIDVGAVVVGSYIEGASLGADSNGEAEERLDSDSAEREAKTRVAKVFSNISDHRSERSGFWRATERAEKVVDWGWIDFNVPTILPYWDVIRNNPNLPRKLRRHIRQAISDRCKWEEDNDPGKRPFRASMKVSTEEAGQYCAALDDILPWARRPVAYRS